MTDDRSEALAGWWDRLSVDDRAELLTLHEDDPLPARHVASLTHALGAGPVGTKWEHEPGYTFRVDARLGAFLDSRRV